MNLNLYISDLRLAIHAVHFDVNSLSSMHVKHDYLAIC